MTKLRCLILAGAASLSCNKELPLPEILASGRYVDYSTWEDGSAICMDGRLAAWDHFIEETAEFLQVEPPTRRIQYVWMALPPFTAKSDEDPDWSLWGCPETAAGCYRHRESADRSVVYSKTLDHPHELVHAVENTALGSAHPVLREGLASYLSRGISATNAEFATAIREILDVGLDFADYGLAMQLVGGLILRDGVEKFKEFRAQVPGDADSTEFAEAYRAVYGEDLDTALVEIGAMKVEGLLPPYIGCGDDAEIVPWTAPGLIDVTLHGECGDVGFYGGGAGFIKEFAIEVVEPDFYEMKVNGPGTAEGQLIATIDSCNRDPLSSVGSFGPLKAGRHALRVFFPQTPELRGEISLRLERYNPSPP